jgi:hypothetical protein
MNEQALRVLQRKMLSECAGYIFPQCYNHLIPIARSMLAAPQTIRDSFSVFNPSASTPDQLQRKRTVARVAFSIPSSPWCGRTYDNSGRRLGKYREVIHEG